MSELDPGSYQYLLAFADDEHMVGARHAAWIGMGPFLEEDLAFCSIAQDELGHALKLYELLLDDQAEMNRFALLRNAADYRSCWLAEAECATWSDALVRHWLYDRAEELRWQALAHSDHGSLVDLAALVEREEVFHRSHAGTYMQRIAASAPGEIAASLETLVPLARGLWDPVAGEAEALAAGTVKQSSAELGEQWAERVTSDLAAWGLPEVSGAADPIGQQQNRTQRSAGFASFHQSLQAVISLDPEAIW